MSIKYECYYCKTIFPADDRIDGYNQGHKVGFLCPKCGNNIQDTVFNMRERVDPKNIKWYTLAVALLLSMLFTKNSEMAIQALGYEVKIFTVLFVVTLILLIMSVIFKPALLKSPTLLTKPVNNA